MSKFIAHKTEDGKIQTMKEHLTNVATMCNKFGITVDMPQTCKLIGLLHDLGKYSEEFLNRISGDGEVCDHATAGGQFIEEYKNLHPLAKQIIEMIVFSHHGGLIDEYDLDGVNHRRKRLEKQVNLEQIKENVDEEIIDAIEHILFSGAVNTEIENMLLKIESITTSKKLKQFYVSLFVKYLFSSLIDADRKDTILFIQAE